MGMEAQCTARFGKKVSAGKAHLETEVLLFRGDFRLEILLKDIRSVEAQKGRLLVIFPQGAASFDLGPQAEKWYLKIRYPRSVIDKLGVKPGSRVSVCGKFPAEFLKQVKERAVSAEKDADLIFLAAEDAAALKRLGPLQKQLKSNGAIWVVYPKGRKDFGQTQVMSAGKAAGLVDVKVVAFSETHSALKWMIPLARR